MGGFVRASEPLGRDYTGVDWMSWENVKLRAGKGAEFEGEKQEQEKEREAEGVEWEWGYADEIKPLV